MLGVCFLREERSHGVGGGGWEGRGGGGGRDQSNIALLPPEWVCIKMGIDVSHCHVSLMEVRGAGQGHKTVSRDHNVGRRKRVTVSGIVVVSCALARSASVPRPPGISALDSSRPQLLWRQLGC